MRCPLMMCQQKVLWCRPVVKVAVNQHCQNARQLTIWSYHAIQLAIRSIVRTHVITRGVVQNVIFHFCQLFAHFSLGPSFYAASSGAIAAIIKPKNNDEVIISRGAFFQHIFSSQKKSKRWHARWTKSSAPLAYYVQLFPCLSFSGPHTISWRCMHRVTDSNQSRHGPGPSATGCVISTQRWIQLVMLLVIRLKMFLFASWNYQSFQTFKRTFKNILTGRIFRSRK